MNAISQLDAISRVRALTEEESREVERLVRKEPRKPTYRAWTRGDEDALLIAARQRGGLKLYAAAHGRSWVSCQQRLKLLKAKRREKMVGRFFYDGEVGGE